MSSIREALAKQRHEGLRPRAGGGYYPAPVRRGGERPVWRFVLAGAGAGALVVAAALWLWREQSTPSTPAPALPADAPSSADAPPQVAPTIVVVAATSSAPDRTDQLLEELAQLRRDVREMRRATPPPELRRPNLAPPESRPAPTPTLRPPAAANVPRTTPFRLEGTLEIGSNVAALIGGEVYHVGDVVAGYRILAIGKNWVQCEGYPGYIEVSSAPIREPRLEHGQDARAVQSRE